MTTREKIVLALYVIILLLATGCTVKCYKEGVYVMRKHPPKKWLDSMEVWKD